MIKKTSLLSRPFIPVFALPISFLSARVEAPIDPNPTVVAGEVAFAGLDGPDAVITQDSMKAIVDYEFFNVLPGGSVQFLQPGSEALILNRVTGATPSLIEGLVTANGQLYFVNPAGVTFGENSVVRADVFLAAAGDLSNSDFLEAIVKRRCCQSRINPFGRQRCPVGTTSFEHRGNRFGKWGGRAGERR